MGQAQFVRTLISDLNDHSSLVGGQAGRGATPADLGDNVKSALIECVRDQINGVGVKREAGGDFNGVPALGVEEKHLSSAALDSGQIIGFEALEETKNLGRVGSASGQSARHGGTSKQRKKTRSRYSNKE
jgi:hypothetical protein